MRWSNDTAHPLVVGRTVVHPGDVVDSDVHVAGLTRLPDQPQTRTTAKGRAKTEEASDATS